MVQSESRIMPDARRSEFLGRKFRPVLENLSVFANLPGAQPLRNRLVDPLLTSSQFTQDLSNLVQGKRKSRYAQFRSSLIDLGRALTTMEYPDKNTRSADYKAQLLTAMQQYAVQLKIGPEQSVPIRAEIALAIHDFAITSFRTSEMQTKRRNRIFFGSGLAGIALTAAFGAYEWAGHKAPDHPAPPSMTPTLTGENLPTWTATVSETRTAGPAVVIDTPIPQAITDRMNSLDFLSQKYHLDAALPSGEIPLGDPGRILESGSLRKNQAGEIQEKLITYLREFNMLTDNRAVYDDGVGGYTEVLVRPEGSEVTVTVTDGSPVTNRIIRYDPKKNLCTVSYEDLTGVHTDTGELDADSPDKLCIVSSNTRKLTLIGFSYNRHTQTSDVFAVITSKK